ncbi:hypothetical protein RJ45_09385 [Photobacterium gaetbulicola]|uniref:PD-(D/E)XK motif protein n=1 Tax=Photobacterium gaetbulicola TaxID=1295392 RepID=A0A0B9G584_9GAMM|nr:PD-(D/E)XK motif protein [Photobacterium gaetbulicola]KHT63903.1 hypothetical protein RJ45_09385 [Photobacterium gaetbulicola]
MKLINENDITLCWNGLQTDEVQQGWQGIPLRKVGTISLYAARKYPENMESFAVGFKYFSAKQIASLPRGAGFKVEEAQLNSEERNWIALSRQKSASLELFTMMATDIFNTLCKQEQASEEAAFTLFISRIKAWQQFMKQGQSKLGKEAELGLVGELTFIRQLIDTGLCAGSLMSTWVGPDHAAQDFHLGIGAVEVKSTLAPVGFAAKIHSLEQLDDSMSGPLFMCGIRFSQSDKGQTLPDIVSDIRSQLEHIENQELDTFDTLLIKSGYHPTGAENYTTKFLPEEFMYWAVNDEFPRLTRAKVPFGVLGTTYTIDVGNIPTSMVLDEVIKALYGN